MATGVKARTRTELLLGSLVTALIAPHLAREIGRRIDSAMIYWFATWQRGIAAALLVFWVLVTIKDLIVWLLP